MRAVVFFFSVVLVISMFFSPAGAFDLPDILVELAGNGDLEKVRYLVSVKQANVNAISSFGQTPLMIAAQNGHLAVVKYLVENGAQLDLRCRNGQTPLMAAAMAGQLSTVKLLVENGADDRMKDSSGWTAAKWAQVERHGDIFRFLSAHNARKQLQAGLILAASHGDLGALRKFLSAGAQPDYIDKEFTITPLMVAIRHNNKRIVRHLLSGDASPNAKDINELTPLHYAAQGGSRELAAMLIDAGAIVSCSKDPTPIHLAEKHGHVALVAFLREKQEEERRIEETAFAISRSDAALMPLRSKVYGSLSNDELRQTADLTKTLNTLSGSMAEIPPARKMPFFISAYVALSLGMTAFEDESPASSDPKITAGDYESAFTPLMNSVRLGVLARVKDLLSTGLPPNDRNGIGETALLLAVSPSVVMDVPGKDSAAIVQLLLNNGADPNLSDVCGQTPLMRAAQLGQAQIVKLLLAKKANPRAVDEGGGTALSRAKDGGHKHVVRLLEQANRPQQPVAQFETD